MPGLGLGQGSGLGDSSSDTSPLELDEYLETEAGEAAGGGLGMALAHTFLLPVSLSSVGGHTWATCSCDEQCCWLSAAEGDRVYLISLLATEHLVVKKNPFLKTDVLD